MTLDKDTFDGALVLQSCKDSHFEDLVIQGAWTLVLDLLTVKEL